MKYIKFIWKNKSFSPNNDNEALKYFNLGANKGHVEGFPFNILKDKHLVRTI